MSRFRSVYILTVSGSAPTLYLDNGTTTQALSSNVDVVNDVVAGNKVYFTSVTYDGSESTFTIWVTNGTAAATPVTSFTTIAAYAGPALIPFGSKLLFEEDDGSLQVTNGSTIQTLASAAVGAFNFTQLGNRFVFRGTDANGLSGLWSSDGTPGGTSEILAGPSPSGAQPSAFDPEGSSAFFNANDASGRQGIWITDGTSGGTKLVVEETSGDKGIYPLGLLGSRLLIERLDASSNYHLLAADEATGATTTIFNGHTIFRVAIAGNDALFVDYDGNTGNELLYVTDGTASGTRQLTSSLLQTNGNPFGFTGWGSKIVFYDTDANGAYNIFIYDTVAGSLSELKPNGTAGLSTEIEITTFGAKFAFTGNDSTGSPAVWVSDGTSAGTVNVFAGKNNGYVANPDLLGVGYDGRLEFNVTDGSGIQDVWATRGTLNSTSQVTGVPASIDSYKEFPQIVAAHDFDDDVHSDILFRNGAGTTYLFTMNDATVTNGATTSTQVGPNWQIDGVGDFNKDGNADIFWFYNNAANPSDPLNGISYISMQNGAGTTASGSGVVQQLGPQWQVVGIGDFNGDYRSDVAYRNTSSGQVYIDLMNGTKIFPVSGFTSQQVSDPHWQIAAIGDFDGDSYSDILWRYDNPSNPSDSLNGVVYEWSMNGKNVISVGLLSAQPGSDNWKVAGTGDFDGDGTTDILFRYHNAANPSDPLNGFTYLDFMNGAQVASGAPTQWQIDESWSIASIADFNGDGKSDILFQRASDGATYIWDMNGAATLSGNFTSMQSGPGWTVQNGVLDG